MSYYNWYYHEYHEQKIVDEYSSNKNQLLFKVELDLVVIEFVMMFIIYILLKENSKNKV